MLSVQWGVGPGDSEHTAEETQRLGPLPPQRGVSDAAGRSVRARGALPPRQPLSTTYGRCSVEAGQGLWFSVFNLVITSGLSSVELRTSWVFSQLCSERLEQGQTHTWHVITICSVTVSMKWK